MRWKRPLILIGVLGVLAGLGVRQAIRSDRARPRPDERRSSQERFEPSSPKTGMAVLFGTVRRKQGFEALPGVYLALQGGPERRDLPEVKTDAFGRYVTEVLPATWRISAHWQTEHSAVQSEESAVGVAAGDKIRHDILLDCPPLLILKGAVITASGQPVPKAKIMVCMDRDLRDILADQGVAREHWEYFVTYADETGRFEVSKHHNPGRHEIVAIARGYESDIGNPTVVDVPAERAVAEFDVKVTVLERIYVDLTGRLVDRSGRPVPGARVVVRQYWPSQDGKPGDFTESATETEADGAFEVRVTSDQVGLRFFHPGHVTRSVDRLEVELQRFAKRTRQLGSIEAETKSLALDIKVAAAQARSVRVYEWPSGPFAELGNNFFDAQLDASGAARLLLDPHKYYSWHLDGTRLVPTNPPGGTEQDAQGNLRITSDGGFLELRPPAK